jgi:hypothetical protein
MLLRVLLSVFLLPACTHASPLEEMAVARTLMGQILRPPPDLHPDE